VTWELASSGLRALIANPQHAARLPASAAASANAAGGLSAAQWLAVFGVALAALVVYLVCAAIWPYGPCFGCVGHPGKKAGSNSRRWGRCRRCKGSGERIRWGYRVVQSMRGGRSS
jgi:hypothetical protein